MLHLHNQHMLLELLWRMFYNLIYIEYILSCFMNRSKYNQVGIEYKYQNHHMYHNIQNIILYKPCYYLMNNLFYMTSIYLMLQRFHMLSNYHHILHMYLSRGKYQQSMISIFMNLINHMFYIQGHIVYTCHYHLRIRLDIYNMLKCFQASM